MAYMKQSSPAKIPLIVILGQTAVGKSDLAVTVAQWVAETSVGGYSGAEIISADSRQVYTGLTIGTGKITAKEMRGIPHHLLDITTPDVRYTALQWKHAAQTAITDIISRGKLPIICGGTGFYISSLIDDLGFPEVPGQSDEQAQLENKPIEELFEELKRLDPTRALTIDMKNKRRLARAIIIARTLGSVPTLTRATPESSPYKPLLIGIQVPDNELKNRIRARLIRRIEVPNSDGITMIQEAERLHSPQPHGSGLSFERMDELGLEYRYLAYFLQMKLSKQDLIGQLSIKIWQYARRQKTWWKKDTRIQWFSPEQIDTITETISSFLK